MSHSLRIAIADDEQDMWDYFQQVLPRLGHTVVAVAQNGRELVDLCRTKNPDLVITDIKMPEMDGIDAAIRIYQDKPVPVILVSAFNDAALIERAESGHIMGYLVKPIKQADLAPTIAIAVHRFEQLELADALAKTDPLTGVLNRRHFRELAGVEMKRAARYHRFFTVVFLDLDGFKAVNDESGHEAGDQVLRTVARSIRANLRATDFVSRLGGDEFVILLSETGPEAAACYLEKIQRQLRDAMRGGDWKVTFSIGAVTYLSPPVSVDELIGRADALMYAVKRSGKDGIKHEILQSDFETAGLEDRRHGCGR